MADLTLTPDLSIALQVVGNDNLLLVGFCDQFFVRPPVVGEEILLTNAETAAGVGPEGTYRVSKVRHLLQANPISLPLDPGAPPFKRNLLLTIESI